MKLPPLDSHSNLFPTNDFYFQKTSQLENRELKKRGSDQKMVTWVIRAALQSEWATHFVRIPLLVMFCQTMYLMGIDCLKWTGVVIDQCLLLHCQMSINIKQQLTGCVTCTLTDHSQLPYIQVRQLWLIDHDRSMFWTWVGSPSLVLSDWESDILLPVYHPIKSGVLPTTGWY